MTQGPWRTPSGEAPVAPFRSSDELITALIEHVARAIEGAILERVRAGEISDKGDPSSTYFFDPPRIRTLVHGAGEAAAPDLAIVRRERALFAQLAASSHALAQACARWQLADDDRRIVLALLAAALSPRVARLFAVLGGDPSAPGLAVDAIAALLAPGDVGLRKLAARLDALEGLALIQLSRADLPLPRRTIAPAPRLLDLALDRGALDPASGAIVIDGAHRVADPALRDALRAILHRGARPVVGAIGIEHDAIGALAAAALPHPVLVAPLAAALDPLRRAVLLREVLAVDGVLAIELDGQGGLAAGAALERLAARAPVVLACPPGATVPRLAIAVLPLASARPSAGEVAAVLARVGAHADGPRGVVDGVPPHPLAIARAAQAIAARGAAASGAHALTRAVVEQLLPVDPPGALRLAGDKAPPRGEEVIERILARWRMIDAPRRTRVLLAGIRGVGKLEIAAALAHRLQIPAFQLERGAAIAPALLEAIDAGAAIGVLRDLNEEDIRGLKSNSWWVHAHGLLVVTTTKRLEPGDAADFDLHLRIEPTSKSMERSL